MGRCSGDKDFDEMDSIEVFGWGDVHASAGDFSPSSTSSLLFFRLNSPLSIPGFLSFRFLSSLSLSCELDPFSMDSKLPRGFTRVSMLVFWPFREKLTSFHSAKPPPPPPDSSRSKLGVREIFLGSAVSSLKNESVFRTVPFLDLLTVGSVLQSEFQIPPEKNRERSY